MPQGFRYLPGTSVMECDNRQVVDLLSHPLIDFPIVDSIAVATVRVFLIG